MNDIPRLLFHAPGCLSYGSRTARPLTSRGPHITPTLRVRRAGSPRSHKGMEDAKLPLSVPCRLCPHFLPAGALPGDGGVTRWKEAGSLG